MVLALTILITVFGGIGGGIAIFGDTYTKPDDHGIGKLTTLGWFAALIICLAIMLSIASSILNTARESEAGSREKQLQENVAQLRAMFEKQLARMQKVNDDLHEKLRIAENPNEITGTFEFPELENLEPSKLPVLYPGDQLLYEILPGTYVVEQWTQGRITGRNTGILGSKIDEEIERLPPAMVLLHCSTGIHELNDKGSLTIESATQIQKAVVEKLTFEPPPAIDETAEDYVPRVASVFPRIGSQITPPRLTLTIKRKSKD